MKLVFLLVLCALNVVDMKPVKPAADDEVNEEEEDDDEDMYTGLEYDKYLRQVISVLEKDPEMRKKMETSNIEDLKSGKLALELDRMPDQYRSQLDELKRIEVQRLRLVAKQLVDKEAGFINKLYRGIPGSNPKELFENLVGHVDPKNPDSFNERDLTNLLRKATKDLDAADKKRRQEFKNYEMEKELQRREKLQEMDQEHRNTAQKEYEEQKKKLKEHGKMKHPGSKAQLEEVWEETDHLDKDDFNPRTFFALHDTNGDGNLDPFELEALFIKEVEKIYQDSKADPKEKFEELARMREHVLREIDTDKNKLVSKEEFLKATDESEFENDEGWEGLIQDLQQDEMFEEEELEGYQKKLREQDLKRQKQREEFEARKQKMQMEHDNFQKNNIPEVPVAMDQAAAQKKLTDIQQGNDNLKFNPAADAVDQEQEEKAQQPIVNHEAVKIQQQGKINAGQPIEANAPPQGNGAPPQGNGVPPQVGKAPPQGNEVPPQEGKAPPQGNEVPPQEGKAPPQGNEVPPQEGKAPPQGNEVPPQKGNEVPPQQGDEVPLPVEVKQENQPQAQPGQQQPGNVVNDNVAQPPAAQPDARQPPVDGQPPGGHPQTGQPVPDPAQKVVNAAETKE